MDYLAKLEGALVTATFVITFFGVLLGIVTAVSALLVNANRRNFEKHKSEVSKLIAKLNEDIDRKDAESKKDRDDYRAGLQKYLITSDKIALVNSILGEYVRSNSVNSHARESSSMVIDYHHLNSSLGKLVAGRTPEDIFNALHEIGDLVGNYGDAFDTALKRLLIELWSEDFFYKKNALDIFVKWHSLTLTDEFLMLPKRRFSS